MDMPYRVPHSVYPQTGLEEINGDLREADFWTTSVGSFHELAVRHIAHN
jgi:hypothetical protein